MTQRRKTVAEHIASAVMDTIEREGRVNKDDLVQAVNCALYGQGKDRFVWALYDVEQAIMGTDWVTKSGTKSGTKNK